jgi:nuclear pore complex protein Nup155
MAFVNQGLTPQRPLPGGFINTPAPNMRFPSSSSHPPPAFKLPSKSAVPQRPVASLQAQSISSQPTGPVAPVPGAAKDLSPVELAKMAINDKLEAEARFPPLEEYIGRTLAHTRDVLAETNM